MYLRADLDALGSFLIRGVGSEVSDFESAQRDICSKCSINPALHDPFDDAFDSFEADFFNEFVSTDSFGTSGTLKTDDSSAFAVFAASFRAANHASFI